MTSENRLIKRIKRYNDRKAADELFEHYYREVYAYVFKQCGECELSMDLTQEIFITAFKGLYSFDEKKASFRTWLYRVASNKVTDYYRSRCHKEFLRQIPLDNISDKIISDDTDITEQLDRKDMIKNIMNIVSGYELEWIRIFQMKCFEDKTFSEIASLLSIAESTAKTRYYTIIRQLRKEYGNEN